MKTTALFLALFAAFGAAQAADVGQHPAIFSPRSLPAVDPSTFIVGHPAGGYVGKSEITETAQAAAKARAETATTSAATRRTVSSIKVAAPQ